MQQETNKTIIKLGSMELEQIDLSQDDELYAMQLDDLVKELQDVNDMSQELSSLIDSQQEKLENIEKDFGNTNIIVDKSNDQLIIASEHQQSLFWQKSSLLTLGTTVVTISATFLVGAKIAIICGIGAFGCGVYGLFH